jgi:hypothetical protein
MQNEWIIKILEKYALKIKEEKDVARPQQRHP